MVEPIEILCKNGPIFGHRCKRQGFQHCYLVIINDIVYEVTAYRCSVVLSNRDLFVVLCAETEEEEEEDGERRAEDGERRAEEETPEEEAKVTNQPQLGSAPTSYPSLLSISYICLFVFTTAHALDYIPCLQYFLVYADATNSWL